MADLAIVAQQPSTGGWGYAVRLATWMKRLSPEDKVTLYCGVDAEISDDAPMLRDAGVAVDAIPPLSTGSSNPPFFPTRRFSARLANAVLDGLRRIRHEARATAARRRKARHAENVSRLLNRHDVVHFAWPFGIAPPALRAPMTFIPHDFTYSLEFGVREEHPGRWLEQRRLHEAWLRNAMPIVSSDFVGRELHRVFPDYAARIPVIPLPCLITPELAEGADDDVFASVKARARLPSRYVLCPNNTHPHKNLHSLMSALWHVRHTHPDIKLVLTGPGTEVIRAHLATPYYADREPFAKDCDIMGLGLLSNTELIAVMRRAQVTVNPSLCEAGSGSSGDAWVSGSPVAMSDIPAFREQLARTGAKAELFDPHDPRDIARAILRLVNDRALAGEYVRDSRAALSRFTWRDTALAYLDILREVADRRMQPTGEGLQSTEAPS